MSNNQETMTFAEQLRSDPRLSEAKQLILDTVADYQQHLVNVRPANPEREPAYQEMLTAFGEIRGGALYFPYLASGLGNGPFVELADGSVKLDMITGIGVHGFGHSHPRMVEAGIDAALSDTVMQGNLQQGPESFELVKLLTEKANETGGNLNHCFLSTSGAMANENSLKIAFQKHQPANRVVAFSHCFAGRTLALSQVTDKPGNRVGLPDTITVDYIPFYRPDDPAGSTELAVNRFREQIKRHPGKIAALWMELVQGEGGYYPGSPDFFRALCAVARENQIAVIADEVQTFGRTSRLYAFQHFELDQHVDLVTIGKISQVCATLYTDDYKPKPGLISQTFTGSSWAIIAAQAIIQGLIDGGHYGSEGRNQQLHACFQQGLERIAERMPDAVSGPYGIGGMVAFTPFAGELEKAKEMVNRMYHAGLMSFIAGSNPVRIRFLMPLGAVEENHIQLACQIIEQVAEEMSAESQDG
ncbi:MAG: aminotransferase class III-fold pyridoxal phosphate-dependent enzyme [Planctomycetota bacterium]|nr:aminotransferase class III-fold pyridoxal phosphate-dependent enzyme [Planctomycetota bacterium]